ncbi:MAG: tetratricopeptide repeat protein [Reyranella sp.]|uniref:tetratricopeptide repeat protein n=1 Tax=Reyranella sp. TaxID=1929291 RepID=UPI00272F5078|nr:tetratricopeptide repeat protein [Reyranella sp.]MDP1964871.1 tetratricopeptide repeat protein [Reyranella sp.]MDP2378080.1 tetratricopeptide repeat protein [Reyranella sp.]
MRRTLLTLLPAALLLALPATVDAQQGGPQAKTPPQTQPQRGRQIAATLDGRYLAGRVAEQDHDYDAAADQMDAALALAPTDPELIYSAFRMRMYAGRIDAAAQLAPQVLAKRPGDGFANLVLAVQAIKKGDYKAAERQLGRIGSENQLGVLRDYVMAWLKAGDKDFAAARTYLAKLKPAAGERSEAPALIIQAQIDELAGDRAAAEAKYRRASSLDRNGLRTTLAAADGLRRLGKTDEARELLKTYGEMYSDAVVMDSLLAANAPAPKPPSPASGIAEILFDIGGILAADPRNQRADLALIFDQLAVNLKPDHDFSWLMISNLYEQFQQIPKAIAALAKIGPLSPLSWQARLRMAALDAQLDRYDQAVSRLKTLIAEKPDRIDAALTLADLQRGKEHYADAVAAYDTAIARLRKVDERHWPVFFGRGIVLERTKQWPKAEADMKKALELSPEQPHVLNYLGYSWVDQGLHLDEGMKMLMKATALRPDDGAITDSVGWAFYRTGQFDKAVEWLERASEQKGDDATITEHLGDAYWHVGRKREARFEWERSLNQKPDKDRVPVIKDKLANGLNASNDKPTVYEKPAAPKQGG